MRLLLKVAAGTVDHRKYGDDSLIGIRLVDNDVRPFD